MTLEPGRTLLDLAPVVARLKQLLNRAVHLVRESGLQEPLP